MIKTIILASLICFTLAIDRQVDVFRGQILILSGQIDFDALNHGIVIKNHVLSEQAIASENSWRDIVFNSGVSDVVIPFRRAAQWEVKIKPHLGAIMQTNFSTDNGDKFQLTLAFGVCNNQGPAEDFKELSNKLEEKRRSNSAALAILFANVKKEASNYISASQLLDDLLDDKVDNEVRLRELKDANDELIAQLSDLNKIISEKEDEEMALEKEASEKCASQKITDSDLSSLVHEQSTYHEHIKILQSQIESKSTLTEDEKAEYDTSYDDLLSTLSEISTKFNSKLKHVEVIKGELLVAEKLRQYFSN